MSQGYQTKNIFVYYPIQNKYYTAKFSFNQKSHKFLVENWIVCFGSCLYEVDEGENLISRQQFNDTCTKGLNTNASFRRGRNIYFIIRDLTLYRINTEKRLIEKVNINT